MARRYQPQHHPRTVERLAGSDAPVKRHHFARGFNGRLGLRVTLIVGSMWAAYAFAVLALISLPAALQTGDKIIIVAWIAQTFLQLVLLPIIIVGQNQQAQASDKRSEQTYKDAEAVLHEALEIQRHLLAQDKHLEAQDRRLREIATR